jgi:hypothetical protein
MGKLHELLAVEPDLKAEATRALNDAVALFREGQVRLIGQIRTYRPLEEAGEEFADEITELATTVEDELDVFAKAMSKWINAAVQKEKTNMLTEASVDLDVGLQELPATALLNLEARLQEIRKVYAAIPTLDPSEQWEWNEVEGEWVSKTRISYKTKKIPKALVLYEATEEHPAQVQAYNEDVRAGEWETIIRTGMFTKVEKQRRLERIDKLQREVKKARQRANDIEAISLEVGESIFEYING